MINLPFLSKTKKAVNKFLTVGINSNDVKCLAFYFDEGGFRIIGSGRQDLESGSVREGVIIEEDEVIEALKIAIAQAIEDQEEIGDVIIGLSGNNCMGLMTSVRSRRDQKTPIEKREVQEFHQKILDAATDQADNDYLLITGNPEIELKSITTSSIYLVVDGTPVSKLEGEEGSIVEAAIFNAFTPNYHLNSLQYIEKKTKTNILALGSEMYALSKYIMQNSRDLRDFLIIDIAEDSTNIGVVFGGGIVSTRSLGFGYKHFVEGIGDKMGLTEGEANKLLNFYMMGKLSESEINVVKSCLGEILDIWVTGLEILFGEFTNVKTFAPKVFLTGKGAQLTDVLNTIESEPWTKSIPFKDVPEFKRLTLSDFPQINDSTGSASSLEWLNTATLSKIYEELMQND